MDLATEGVGGEGEVVCKIEEDSFDLKGQKDVIWEEILGETSLWSKPPVDTEKKVAFE